MRILIVSATSFEIQPLLGYLEKEYIRTSQVSYQKGNLEVFTLITGVGQANTVYGLTRALAGQSFNLVLHAGIAGARDLKMYPIGAVVQVVNDVFADVGAEEENGVFLPLSALGLSNIDPFPYTNGQLIAPEDSYLPSLAKVKGQTVNCIPGSQTRIQQLEDLFHADIETMESAATFLVCLSESIPFLQIRSISNKIEPRNRASWNIPLAIERLNEVLVAFVQQW